MKLGFVSAILPELTFEEIMKTAHEIGYDCVEVMCWPKGKAERRYAGVTHIDVSNLNFSEIKKAVNNTGVEISALGYYPNPLSPQQEESQTAIEHIKRVIDAASTLNIGMNTFVGRDWKRSVEENWPIFLAHWKPIISHAEKQNVRIGIENCPMFFTEDEWPGGKNLATSPTIWRRMFKEIASNYFGLNFDPSHFIWQHMDYLTAMSEFRSKLFHIHAKDVRLDLSRLNEVGIMAFPNQYHTPKLPGMGDVDWGKFFSVLTDSGYDGPICVEVEDRAFEGSLEKRIESLKISHQYLRQYIPKR